MEAQPNKIKTSFRNFLQLSQADVKTRPEEEKILLESIGLLLLVSFWHQADQKTMSSLFAIASTVGFLKFDVMYLGRLLTQIQRKQK